MSYRRQQGFSLTEIAVVLVVISLLLAAVVQGGNILKAAKLKTVTAEFSEKQSWINGFRTIYDQLPGDFSYAADYWAAASTVSGDADGEIEFYDGSAVYEGFRAWEHLSYAEVADSQFSGGPATPTSTAATVGVDVPDSVVNNAGYFFDYNSMQFTDENIIAFGVPIATAGNSLILDGALKPSDAFQLDAKMDDGVPSTGSLRGQDGENSTANDCITAGGSYDTTKDGIDCVLSRRLSTE